MAKLTHLSQWGKWGTNTRGKLLPSAGKVGHAVPILGRRASKTLNAVSRANRIFQPSARSPAIGESVWETAVPCSVSGAVVFKSSCRKRGWLAYILENQAGFSSRGYTHNTGWLFVSCTVRLCIILKAIFSPFFSCPERTPQLCCGDAFALHPSLPFCDCEFLRKYWSFKLWNTIIN